MVLESSHGMEAFVYAAAFAALIAVYLWGLWVARRQATLVFRIAARGALLGGILTLAGAAWAMRQVASAAESASDAAQYAQAISGAFARAALPIGIGNLTLLASVVVLAVGTLRRKRVPVPPG